MTMNGPSYFEIQADDVSRARQFYGEIFGWKFSRAEDLPVEYWRIETDGPRGGLLLRPVPAPRAEQGSNAFVCSMSVDDFDAIAKIIVDRGGIVALPKFAVPGVCWQGYFLDPEGNTFGMYQPDPEAR
jgi:predicted enzyme related to lactoylglutathione lyase